MPLLDWLHKSHAVKTAAGVPYRLLNAEATHGDPAADNWLIQGDNLEALKALLPFFAGRVKCITIDPPYNTRSAFEHYDDNLEHSQWLSMMYPRLELLRELLAEDGSIWVSIDDNEAHYLKVVMDEVFGRANFVAEIIWQKRTSRENRAAIGSAHDTLLLYTKKTAVEWKSVRNLLAPNAAGFANPDSDPRGVWRSIPFSAQGFRPNQMYKIVGPDGTRHTPPKGRCWGATEPEFQRLLNEQRVYFPKGGSGKPRIKLFAGEEKGLVPMTIWFADEVGDTEESKKEILALFDEDSPFGTPKPERLIERIIHIATNPNDLVLDSFLGSGTTAAVAHKMGRRWIGIEMGEHARTHCLPRLQKVVEGEQGGISEAVGWQGGGGFRFFTLGEPAFLADGGINPDIHFETLAAWLWYQETRTPWKVSLGGTAPLTPALSPQAGRGSGGAMPGTPLLGIHEGTAYVLLYNGILGDRRPAGGNVLTSAVLAALKALLPEHRGAWAVFGESCRLSKQRLSTEGVRFKQIPYDITAR